MPISPAGRRSRILLAVLGLVLVTAVTAIVLVPANLEFGGDLWTDPQDDRQVLGQWRAMAAFAYTSGGWIGQIFALMSGVLVARWSTRNTRRNTHDNRQSTHDNRQSTHDNRQSTHNTRQSAHNTRQSTQDTRQSTHENRQSTHDNRQSTHNSRLSAHNTRQSTHSVRWSAHNARWAGLAVVAGLGLGLTDLVAAWSRAAPELHRSRTVGPALVHHGCVIEAMAVALLLFATTSVLGFKIGRARGVAPRLAWATASAVFVLVCVPVIRYGANDLLVRWATPIR
jgi:hypothetical protein